MKKKLILFVIFLFFIYSENTNASQISYWLTTWITSCPLWWELIPSQRWKSWLSTGGTLTCQKAVARLWVNYWASFSYSINSWKTSCPAWQEILTSALKKHPWTSWNISCMKVDDDVPVIDVNLNWYTNDVWTNKDVKLNISVSDVWTWIKKVTYKVNWTSYVWSSNFELNFTEEWIYNVEIQAEDKSTHELWFWTPVDTWNISKKSYIIKIDKSAPALVTFSATDSVNWLTQRPVISYKIVDTYKWVSIEQKTFMCSWKPENSEWLSPTLLTWELTWTCDPNSLDCTNDYNFTPNPNHTTLWCRWACSWWYTKWEDDKCYLTNIVNTCSWILTWMYKYNKNDYLEKLNDDVAAYWTGPTWVMEDWDFASKINPLTLEYSPDITMCQQQCNPGTIYEFWKCVNENALVCCQSTYPLSTYKTVWVEVDCSLPENSNDVSCVKNEFCWWYVKDVMKIWDFNKWIYTDGINNEDTLTEICWQEPIENSNWFTCNSKYYLTWSWTANQKCEIVPIWEYSAQDNEKYLCDNKPNNSYYTSNGDNNNCNWTCNSWYYQSWWKCLSINRISSCNDKPHNTVWNTVSEIPQVRIWGSWLPTRNPVYNIEPSTTECRFKCAKNYSWDWSNCIRDRYQTTIYNWTELFALNETKDFLKIHDKCVILDVYNDKTDNKVILTNNSNEWNLKITDKWTEKRTRVYMLCSNKVSNWWSTSIWYPCIRNSLEWIFYDWECNVWNYWEEPDLLNKTNISSYCFWDPWKCE